MNVNHYIFVANDAEYISGGRANGFDLAKHRLKKNVWPLYNRTRHKNNISQGDKTLIYIAGSGPNKGCVVAASIVKKIDKDLMRSVVIDTEDVLSNPASSIVHLEKTEFFPNPINFKSNLLLLECRPKNLTKWGVILFGGVRRISQVDYMTLLRNPASKTSSTKRNPHA